MSNLARWIVLLCAVLASYLAVCWNGFVYDDHGSITENPFLQRSDALGRVLSLRTFTDPHVLDGQRPLVILSYLLDRAFFGASPTGYHAVSLAWHLGSVGLLYALLLRMTMRPGVAFAAAILFGLHPALTEAVAVPAFREDLLAAFFVLLFLWLAVGERPWRAALALALGLAAKETAVVAPVLLAWLWVCFPALRPARKLSFLLLGASSALVLVYVLAAYATRPLQASASVWNGISLPWPANLWTAPWLLLRWLKILLVPYPLCADYVVQPVASLLDVRAAAGLLAGALLAASAWWCRKGQPVLAFGLGWLLVNFAPVSNVVPLFNPLADRYLYLPAAGFALAVAVLVARMPARATVVAALTAIYAGLIFGRLGDWRNDERLWTETARVEPRSARAQTWLGLLAAQRGDGFEAMTRYTLADELNPRDVSALINAAVLDGQRGDLATAERRLRMAVARRPDKLDGWWNLAIALRMQGREAESEAAARKAAAINPLDPRVRAFAAAPRS